MLPATLALDPLDAWTRHLLGEPLTGDTQTILDIALDCARAGFYAEAIELVGEARRGRLRPLFPQSSPETFDAHWRGIAVSSASATT